MRTATGRRALYGRGGYDPCEAGVCARFPCTSQERWLAPSRRETLLLLPLVQPATVDRLQRSNFVDSTSEEVVRSTPSTAPIRSVSASMSPIVGTTPVAAKRSEEHTSELQSLMRNSYAVFCLKKKNTTQKQTNQK